MKIFGGLVAGFLVVAGALMPFEIALPLKLQDLREFSVEAPGVVAQVRSGGETVALNGLGLVDAARAAVERRSPGQ